MRSYGACSAAPGRDPTLDIWRGLALADMVLVHLAWNGVLPEPLDSLIRHHTRFAAGGLVFLSGLTVALAFSAQMASPGVSRRRAHRWLWRRAVVLLVLDRAVAAGVGLLVLGRIALFRDDDVAPDVRALLLFDKPGVTGGLLLLYALLLAATPLAVAFQRRFGRLALTALSAGVYLLAYGSEGRLHWPQWTFPVAYWQPIFVAGVLAAPAYQRLRSGPASWRIAWAAVSGAAFGVVWLLRYGETVGLPALPAALRFDFVKVPLQPAELIWYLTATQAALASSWLGIESVRPLRRVLAWFGLFGRNSLLVYAVHLFTEIPIATYVVRSDTSVWERLSLVALDLAALAAAAHIAESRASRASTGVASARGRGSLRTPFAAATAIAISWFALLLVRGVVERPRLLATSLAGDATIAATPLAEHESVAEEFFEAGDPDPSRRDETIDAPPSS